MLLDLCILGQGDHIKCIRTGNIEEEDNGSVEGDMGDDILTHWLPGDVSMNSLHGTQDILESCGMHVMLVGVEKEGL